MRSMIILISSLVLVFGLGAPAPSHYRSIYERSLDLPSKFKPGKVVRYHDPYHNAEVYGFIAKWDQNMRGNIAVRPMDPHPMVNNHNYVLTVSPHSTVDTEMTRPDLLQEFLLHHDPNQAQEHVVTKHVPGSYYQKLDNQKALRDGINILHHAYGVERTEATLRLNAS